MTCVAIEQYLICNSNRFWWIISFVLSMIGCCLLIKDSYQKWDESPVIVTFSEKMTSIKNIPFPAVTICHEVKSKKEIFDFTDAVYRFNPREPPFYELSEDEYKFSKQRCNIKYKVKQLFQSKNVISKRAHLQYRSS